MTSFLDFHAHLSATSSPHSIQYSYKMSSALALRPEIRQAVATRVAALANFYRHHNWTLPANVSHDGARFLSTDGLLAFVERWNLSSSTEAALIAEEFSREPEGLLREYWASLANCVVWKMQRWSWLPWLLLSMLFGSLLGN